jgi:hypothetical protein
MNQLRSRLSSIALVLLIPMAFVGCSQNCSICYFTCFVLGWGNLIFYYMWTMLLCPECLTSADLTAISQFCEENPDECAATWEEMQLTAIQICEEYPDECQEAFDSYVESFEEEGRP